MSATRIPVNTYRLQLHRGFPFSAAIDALDTLWRLGVTDLYLSPYLAAQPGSTHGYDICDHRRINPELGGERGLDRLVAALAERGMGHVLDFVPNHMGNDSATNRWWRDVLEHGRASAFARYFDIEWNPLKPEARGKVLIPILGDQYGRVLERGELRLERAEGGIRLRYFEHDLPLDPKTLPAILRPGLEGLRGAGVSSTEIETYDEILRVLDTLPDREDGRPESTGRRRRDAASARAAFARLLEESPAIAARVDGDLEHVNGVAGEAASFDALHAVLERQAYRLAYWRTAFHEINYRRFFDVNQLAGLRVEDEEVFEATHGLVLRLVDEGKITGLRLDHLDGLFDPAGYLERLRSRVGGLYVVVEKILCSGEELREDWPVQGTSGYEFLNDVSGVFIESSSAAVIRRFYERFAGRRAPFTIVRYVGKKLITQTSLASDLNVLAHELNRISELDRRSRDYTLESLREALREIVACFPVYRSYVSGTGASEGDRRVIETAVTAARRRNPAMERSLFDFVRAALLPPDEEATQRERRLELAMRVQQYTAPVQAKGVEDTALYRHVPLASLSEVGGDPARFGRSPEELHDANRRRQARWPYSMLTTTTHDTKRGEDVRARLNALTEIPAAWRSAVSRWARVNARHRTRVGEEWAPDRNEEYLLYQTLVGMWPPGAGTEAAPGLLERVQEYAQKALREAKLHSSWANVDEVWERAVAEFLERALCGDKAGSFLSTLVPFARSVARLGVVGSLGQLLLKIASPGVCDLYQGSELWDLSLVDPDNRRPVDFALRARLLAILEPVLEQPEATAAEELLSSWPDGRIKLYVTAVGLRLRRSAPELFLHGGYEAVDAEGERARHVVALARGAGDRFVLAIISRLAAALTDEDRPFPLGPRAWGDTRLRLSDTLRGRMWTDVLTGERRGPDLDLANVCAHLPVALLTS